MSRRAVHPVLLPGLRLHVVPRVGWRLWGGRAAGEGRRDERDMGRRGWAGVGWRGRAGVGRQGRAGVDWRGQVGVGRLRLRLHGVLLSGALSRGERGLRGALDAAAGAVGQTQTAEARLVGGEVLLGRAEGAARVRVEELEVAVVAVVVAAVVVVVVVVGPVPLPGLAARAAGLDVVEAAVAFARAHQRHERVVAVLVAVVEVARRDGAPLRKAGAGRSERRSDGARQGWQSRVASHAVDSHCSRLRAVGFSSGAAAAGERRTFYRIRAQCKRRRSGEEKAQRGGWGGGRGGGPLLPVLQPEIATGWGRGLGQRGVGGGREQLAIYPSRYHR